MRSILACPADITLINLNMLFMRFGEEVERELHVPLGPLYLTRALEDAGLAVDFRDYQTVASDKPFDMDVFLDFLRDPAPVIGLSCMANLLPFTMLAMKALRERYPEHTLVLGGVGSKAVEEKILTPLPLDRHHLPRRGRADRPRARWPRSAAAAIWPTWPAFRSAATAGSSTRPTARGSPTSIRSPSRPSRRST